MEQTKALPESLFLFECKQKHRIHRHSRANNASCSRCGNPFHMIAEVPREADETEIAHRIRTLDFTPPRVH